MVKVEIEAPMSERGRVIEYAYNINVHPTQSGPKILSDYKVDSSIFVLYGWIDSPEVVVEEV